MIEGTCDAESSIDVSFVGGDVVLAGGRAGGIEATGDGAVLWGCPGLHLFTAGLKVEDDHDGTEGMYGMAPSLDVSFVMGGDVVLLGGRAGKIEGTVNVLCECPGVHLFAAGLKVEDDYIAIEGRQDEPSLDVSFVAIFDADRGRSSGD